MIISLLGYVSTEAQQRPAELAYGSLHDLVHDAVCIIVPGRIFPCGKYLIFYFSRCPDIMIPLMALGGFLAYVGYIKEPR